MRITIQDSVIFPTHRRKRLVVILHAWRQTPDRLCDLVRLVHEKVDDVDIDIPQLPLSTWSCVPLEKLSERIVERIDFHWEERCRHCGAGYSEIIIIGHSTGATLARSVYLYALGTRFSAPRLLSAQRRVWADCVSRLVLFAAFNRGWEVSYPAQSFRAVGFAIGLLLMRVFEPFYGAHVMLQLYRGSPFINEMRLRWQELERLGSNTNNASIKHEEQRWPFVVQLLGSSDPLIAPEDSLDIATGQHFAYLEAPFTDHFNIVELYAPRNRPFIGRFVDRRRGVFTKALCAAREELRDESVVKMADQTDQDIEDVVFIIHGIRDPGFWAQHIARVLIAHAKKEGRQDRIKTLCPSYGYFGMGPFLLKWNRRAKVAWFMEQYLLARALYPRARVSYIGHSNGTYLPTCALELYPSCKFDRLAFAGSVVRSNYPWKRYLPNPLTGTQGRVEKICNFVATEDLVVAGFPSLYEFLGVSDLGGAGHNGFSPESAGAIVNYRYSKGGHSSALAEEFWGALSDFILNGVLPVAVQHLAVRRQLLIARVVGAFPPLAWALAISLAAATLWLAIEVATTLSSYYFPAYGNHIVGASVVLWLWGITIVLRKL